MKEYHIYRIKLKREKGDVGEGEFRDVYTVSYQECNENNLPEGVRQNREIVDVVEVGKLRIRECAELRFEIDQLRTDFSKFGKLEFFVVD